MELEPRKKEEFLTDIYKALASISTAREKVRLLLCLSTGGNKSVSLTHHAAVLAVCLG